MDGWRDEWTDRQVNKLTDRQIDGIYVDRQIMVRKWVDRWMIGRIHRCMDEKMK